MNIVTITKEPENAGWSVRVPELSKQVVKLPMTCKGFTTAGVYDDDIYFSGDVIVVCLFNTISGTLKLRDTSRTVFSSWDEEEKLFIEPKETESVGIAVYTEEVLEKVKNGRSPMAPLTNGDCIRRFGRFPEYKK